MVWRRPLFSSFILTFISKIITKIRKEIRTFSDLPIIVFSASPGNHDRALQLGANDFMPEPFDADEMDSRIKKLIPD